MKGVLLLTLLAGLQNVGSARAEAFDICRYHLVFSEDFSDFKIAPHALGTGRWTAHTPWNGDFGDAVFTDPGPAGPFSVANGELRITASRSASGRWQSGLIAAADASGRGEGIQYGYFEVKMRIPPGDGTWPGFWLASLKPANEQVPSIEIDVVEYYGHDDTDYMASFHVWYPPERKDLSRHMTKRIDVKPGSLISDFHTYGVLVEPDKITYMLDREPVWEVKTPPEYRLPMYPLINLALGSGYSISNTPNPSVLRVKYVRMYAPGKGKSC